MIAPILGAQSDLPSRVSSLFMWDEAREMQLLWQKILEASAQFPLCSLAHSINCSHPWQFFCVALADLELDL